MKSINKPSCNSWKHPFWKFGCLLPIILFFGAAFLTGLCEGLTGTGEDKDNEKAENQAKIDSLSQTNSNLVFEGIALGKVFNKNALPAYNLKVKQSGAKLDSCSYQLRHNDYNSGHNLNSNQDVYVYTTSDDIVYQIFISMKNDDVYTDAFFEKYGIENATKKEQPNTILWSWTWSNQMLELAIPKGSMNLKIRYLDFDAQKRWLQIKQSEYEAEINALMRDKEDSKANI